jgi:uncharacterized protein
MATQSFMDRILRRARMATSDADLNMLKDEMEGKVPPDLMNGNDDMDDDGNDGIHMHVHLPGNGNGAAADVPGEEDLMQDQGEPDLPGGDIADLAARLAALEQKVAELLDGDEGEVELQNPGDAQDAKRYIMRRGSRLKAHDEEEIPIPERLKEMIGETDLPGLEDLDARTALVISKSNDSVNQEMLWQDTMAKGEIIVPGIRIPTFDSRVKATTTAQRLCSFRRQTLDAALDIPEASDVLAGLVGVKTKDHVKSLPCETLKVAFETTANMLAHNRNNGIVRSSVADSLPGYRHAPQNGSSTLSEIQRRNREAWKTGEFKPIH